MKPIGIVCILAGVGMVVALATGWSLGSLSDLAGLHASIGIAGVAVIGYLFYASLKSNSALLKAMSLITLILTVVGALTGLWAYLESSPSLASAHLGGGVALLFVMVITGAIAARSSRKAM